MGAASAPTRSPQVRGLRWAGLASATAVTAIIAFGLNDTADRGLSANVTLKEVDSGPERTAIVTATMRPRDAADGATWVRMTSWQGGGLVLDNMKEIRPGRL